MKGSTMKIFKLFKKKSEIKIIKMKEISDLYK